MKWGEPDISSEKMGPSGHPQGAQGERARSVGRCCSLKLDLGNWVMKTGSLEVELGLGIRSVGDGGT